MKNKNITYVLIFGVLVIWGLIFYRIFSGIGSGEDAAFSISPKKVIQNRDEKEETVLVLYANYRDPFLGGISGGMISSSYQQVDGALQKKKKPPVVKVEKPPIDWSFIKYVGIVNNKETKKKVGLVILSGQERMVNEMDIIQGVTFLKKERDSIEVEYLEERKWIKR